MADSQLILALLSTASGYIFRSTFRSLSDVLYSDECRTKKAFSVFQKNVAAISCCSKVLYY